jgi:branched-chain amino acid transport system substrate-binding protein
MSVFSRLPAAWTVLVIVGLSLSACSTSGGSAAPAGGSSSVSSSPSTSGQIDQATINTALKYTDGKAEAANPSLKPVQIGFVNQEGGAPAFPENDGAADAVVKFINQYQDGIDGHPIQLVKCVIQTEEDGQKCAAQFLADPDIHIAELGTAVVGNETFYNTVNGTFPVLVALSGGLADDSTPDVYLLDSGSEGVLSAFVSGAKAMGAKKVSIISTANSGGKYDVGQILIPSMKQDGMTPTAAYVSDTATTPEYTSAVQASGAENADVIELIASGAGQCLSVYKALQELAISKPVITAYGCYGDPVPAATNGGPLGWTFYGNSENQRAASSPEASAFRNIMEAEGEGQYINVGATPKTFTDFFAIAQMGNKIGFDGLSGPAFESQIKALRAPVFMVPGGIECGHYPDKIDVGVCGDSVAVSSYTGGKWVLGAPVQTVSFTP